MNEDKKDLIIKSLSRYLPEIIVNKIKMAPEKTYIEGERRRATILFMDISGFTAISENLDPEAVTSTLNDFFNRMRRIIEKYGGIINKFMGDAMLVLWGALKTYEDDDERAVRAAMDMMTELNDFNENRSKEIREKFPISMTLGINTGIAFSGNVGSDKRMEYTVIGDNVNLAARLESMANPGEIMISESTAKSLSPEILLKDGGKVAVKGKKEPVQVYLVGGLKSEIGELIERSSFFMERIKLSSKLNSLLKDNNFIQVVGQSGSGKTAFIRNQFKNYGYISAPSYEKNSSFGFIKRIIATVLNLNPNDESKQKQVQIQRFIQKNREYLHSLPVFLDIYNIKSSLKGEERKWKIFELTSRILNNIKNGLILDHLDNIDGLSLEFVKYFINLEEYKDKIILISRKEIIEGLPILNIPDISKKETLKYLLQYYKKEFIPDELADKIFTISKGNIGTMNGLISYLEKEKLIYLKEKGVYLRIPVDKLRLPEQFRTVIITIFDSYNEYTKKFLQYASILGNEFSIPFLNKLINYKQGRIEGVLRTLIGDQILKKRDENNYIFNDENFRASIYELILKSKRKELHTKVGEELERANEEIFTIGYHYVRGNDKKKAVEYAKKIIENGYDNYDNQTVITYCDYGTSFLDTKNNEENVYFIDKKMKSYFRLSYFKESLQFAEKLKKIIKKLKDEEKILDIENTIAVYNNQIGNIDKAIEILKKLLSEGTIKNYSVVFLNANMNLALSYKIKKNLKNAERYYLKALDIGIKNKLNLETVYRNLDQLYLEKDESDRSEDYLNKSIENANKNKNFSILCASLTDLGKIYMLKKDYNKTIEYNEKSLNIANEKGLKYWESINLNNIAKMNETIRKYEITILYYKKAIYINRGFGDYENIVKFNFNIGRIYSLINELLKADNLFNEALKFSIKINNFMNNDIILEIATLYRKMGLSKKYLRYSEDILKKVSKKNEFLYSFFTLHRYIGYLELKIKIPSELKRKIEEIKKLSVWSDLSIVYDFFTLLNNGNVNEMKEITNTLINEIGDPELLSFLFPEIADICFKLNKKYIERLQELLTDQITKNYVRYLKGEKLNIDEKKLFYRNGLYQIYQKVNNGKNIQIKSQNKLYEEL